MSTKETPISMSQKKYPPLAEVRPYKYEKFGITVEDNYAWLKDDNWQLVVKNPVKLSSDIRNYLESENEYLATEMEHTKKFQELLFSEMKNRVKEDDQSVPMVDGSFSYFQRFAIGGEYPIFCRYQDETANEEILLNCDMEADNHSYFKIASCTHSDDHEKLAYAIDLNGSERFQLLVRDLSTGKNLDTWSTDGRGDLVWGCDNNSIYYTVLDENHRPFRVLRHTLGEPSDTDHIIYEESDPGFFLGISRSQDKRFLIINSHDHTTSEVRIIDLIEKNQSPILISPRKTGLEYDVFPVGEQLFILTNIEDAEDFKIVETNIKDRSSKNWQEVVPHEPGRLILGLLEFEKYIVRLERKNGLPRIIIRNINSKDEHEISFQEEAYDLSLIECMEFSTNTLRFSYSSMTTPLEVYDYDMDARTRVLRKKQEIPSGHDPANYVTKRLMAEAHDGELIPVSILYKADTKINGSSPLLLYGYGSYGFSVPASFSPNRLSLVDRGYIYAVAHIRGGTEKGYRWYLNGKLDKKINTFRDFISAAEMLIEEKYTSPGKISIHGGSAGGLLIGACTNMRPELWGAAVGEVPFVDVLTTISDASLPLTPPEWPEWGNPIEDKKAFNYIRSYSPIDNVSKQSYPWILATGGISDPRVTYWEPAKWVAKLRANKTDSNPLFLKTNMEAGHGGSAGRFQRLKEIALVYAFVLDAAGLIE